MTYEVQLQALKKDADTWDTTSSTLFTAENSAWGLTLGETELSWAAATVGLTDSYTSAQNKVAMLLADGSTQTGNISQTLLQVKHNYEVNEHSAEQQYRGAWEPVG